MNGEARNAATSFEQCESRLPTVVFSRYAYGDPLPVYARFVGEEGVDAKCEDAIPVYVRCEREAGHAGKHLARETVGWTDEDAWPNA